MKTISLIPLLAVVLLSACATKPPVGTVRGQYVADGVTEVILRAYGAEHATVTNKKPKGKVITVKGMASGGVGDYRSRDEEWHASSAVQWGLEFVATQFGSTLVISTANEIAYEQHRYMIDQIEIDLPSSVRFVPQPRHLTVSGSPDLSAP